MKLKEIMKLLDAQLLCGEDKLDMEIDSAFASDFMSDILAYVADQKLLLTGMINPQVIRTAEMVDMSVILFVRGKVPDENMLKLAEESDMAVLTTKKLMYTSCGLLYENGIR